MRTYSKIASQNHFAFLFEQTSVNLVVDSDGRLGLDVVSYGKGVADE